MEGVTYVYNQMTLLGNQVELCLDIAVDTLTSLTTDGDDGCISTLNLLIDSDRCDRYLRIFLLSHHLCLEPLGRMALCLELNSGKRYVFTIDVGESSR